MIETAVELHREDLETVISSVFATMMGLEIWPSSEPCPASGGTLTAAVYLTGPWSGAACVQCRPQQARSFAARFLGMPAPETVDNDVRDVMGELANMLAGNLKCTLAPGIRVSIPSVTDGSDYALRVCGAEVVCRASFGSEEGPFWITLVESSQEER